MVSINHFHSLWITRTRVASPRLLSLLCHKPLCQHHHSTVNHLLVFLFLFFVFEWLNIVPTKLTQREGQDFLWHHQELPPLRANAARPTEATSHCEARNPELENNVKRVSIPLPPEHHMAETVWVMWCFYVFLVSYSTNQQKSSSHSAQYILLLNSHHHANTSAQ